MSIRACLLLACMALAPTAPAATINTVAMPTAWNPLDHPEIGRCLALLLTGSRGGSGNEQAAFIVLDETLGFRCLRWRGGETGRHFSRFRGTIPAGTVAIAHTHPRGSPQPSHHDRSEAARLDIPILVVTSGGVTIARPGAVRASSALSRSRP